MAPRRWKTYAGLGLETPLVRHVPRRERAYCRTCCVSRQFTEGKCDHCAAPLAAEPQIWDLPVFGWAWKGDAKDKRA